MAAHSDSDEDDTFVTLGTPLDVPDEDEAVKKPVRPEDVQATDSKGRPRFHGAFTGGFSAGYFNTVGSKEGWAPSTFVSSREKRPESKFSQKPEDFMDEEDFSEYGIAPRKLVTGGQFASEERRKRRLNEAQLATADSIIPGEAALLDLIVPEKLTVGVKLLRKMGWKEGQGIGPRLTKKQKKKSSQKMYGCALPPSPDSDDGLDDESFLSDVTFAPKDIAYIFLSAKVNTQGLGYRGLDPKKALPGTHISLFELPRITKGGSSRKGIRGQAFGVGALEDDDEDIYAVDSMSNYDMTMGGPEDDDKFGWTGPSGRRAAQTPVGYVGKLLDGFTLSSKKLIQKKDFPPPKLPNDYRPVHSFRKKEELEDTSNKGVDYRQFLKPADDTAVSATPSVHLQAGQRKTQLRDATSRSLQLGEQPFVGSVFDLISKEDKSKMERSKQGTTTEPGTSAPRELVPESSQRVQETVRPAETVEVQRQKSLPLFQGGVGFKPFQRDPTKQQRYERYLEMVKLGHRDPYSAVIAPGQTEWEIETEKEEFHKAAKLYRPLAGMMAMRFTRGGHVDDDKVDVKVEQTTDVSDAEKAAQMKMYGKLTRDVVEWHPEPLICKRFNVPNPYPGSTIVGLATVRREKYSVFNFLNFSSPTSAEQELMECSDVNQTAQQNDKSNTTSENTESSEQSSRVDKELGKGKAMKSIFSHLVETEKETQRTTKPVSFSLKPAKSNKPKEFKSIFSHLENEEVSVKFSEEKESAPKEKVVADKQESGESVKKKEASEGTKTSESGQQAEEPSMDLFRAIFRNTDSEESSSSEEEEQKHAEDSSSQQQVSKTAEDNSALQTFRGDNQMQVDSDQVSNTVLKDKGAESSLALGPVVEVLPGSGEPIQSLDARLSPDVTQSESEDDETYGPALPPANSTVTDHARAAGVTEELSESKHSSSKKHKHKDRHKHKNKKDKKEKHKKSKHKRKNKKKKKSKHAAESTDETETSDKETSDDDDDDGATDREILNRLKQMKPGQRMRASDYL